MTRTAEQALTAAIERAKAIAESHVSLYPTTVGQAGACNFCTRQSFGLPGSRHQAVYVLRGDAGATEARLCDACLADLAQQATRMVKRAARAARKAPA